MELLKVSMSLIVAIVMMKFQPEKNNEKLIFTGLTFVIAFLLTKDIRSSLLIVIISYLLNNIFESNKDKIKMMLGLSKENFTGDSDSEEDTDDESDEILSGSESEEENESDTEEEYSDDESSDDE